MVSTVTVQVPVLLVVVTRLALLPLSVTRRLDSVLVLKIQVLMTFPELALVAMRVLTSMLSCNNVTVSYYVFLSW